MTPSEQSYRLIPLTQGQWAIVDADRYTYLMQWKWFAHWEKNTQTFYACRSEKGQTIWMHREILGLKLFDGKIGDHRNRKQTLDNRINNLRIATRSQSMHNQRARKSKLGVKGVTFNNDWFMVRIGLGGKKIYIGRRRTLAEAKALSLEAQAKYHGEFACSE